MNVRHFSTVIGIALTLVGTGSHTFAYSSQRCNANNCVQIGINKGIINAKGSEVRISINNGEVTITGNPEDELQIRNLESQIKKYIRKISDYEKRNLSDKEMLAYAKSYTNDLFKQLEELEKIIVKLDQSDKLTQQIIEAKEQLDVPRIKELLKQKQIIDDGTAAETAFELGNLQELDLEYVEANENYNKAAFLVQNDKYLVAAGTMVLTLGKMREDAAFIKKEQMDIIETTRTANPNIALGNEPLKMESVNNEYDEAIRYYERALDSNLKLAGKKLDEVTTIWNNLGVAWQFKGNQDKAIQYLELALESDLKEMGKYHSHVARDLNNLGSVWRDKGNYDKAIQNLEQALAIDLKLFGKQHPNVARDYRNLGLVWRDKGNYDKAIHLLELAMDRNIKAFGDYHPIVAIDRLNLGKTWQDKGNQEKALSYYTQALTVLKNILGSQHPYTEKTAIQITQLQELRKKIYNP